VRALPKSPLRRRRSSRAPCAQHPGTSQPISKPSARSCAAPCGPFPVACARLHGGQRFDHDSESLGSVALDSPPRRPLPRHLPSAAPHERPSVASLPCLTLCPLAVELVRPEPTRALRARLPPLTSHAGAGADPALFSAAPGEAKGTRAERTGAVKVGPQAPARRVALTEPGAGPPWISGDRRPGGGDVKGGGGNWPLAADREVAPPSPAG
jgi:hypothetical protein